MLYVAVIYRCAGEAFFFIINCREGLFRGHCGTFKPFLATAEISADYVTLISLEAAAINCVRRF